MNLIDMINLELDAHQEDHVMPWEMTIVEEGERYQISPFEIALKIEDIRYQYYGDKS